MLLVGGSRVCYRTIGRGIFHCERCGGDRPYRHRSGRRWAHLLGVPIMSLGSTGEHLCCTVCGTCYRVELLAVPTTAQMQVALLAGTTAAVHAMLRAGGAGLAGSAGPSGGAGREAARRLGVEVIRNAGAPEYDQVRLEAALASLAAEPGPADPADPAGPLGQADPAGPSALQGPADQPGPPASDRDDGSVLGLRPALEALAIQLDMRAREWFLTKVVQVGLAGGSLSMAERDVVGMIARYLGLTQVQARAIISLNEEAAQAG